MKMVFSYFKLFCNLYNSWLSLDVAVQLIQVQLNESVKHNNDQFELPYFGN